MFLKTTVITILTFLNTLFTNVRKSAVVITVGCCDFSQTPEIQIVVTAPNPLFPTNLKCHENLSTGAELLHADGRTDGPLERHDEGNRCFSQVY
jgi:hypothetical protein